MNNKKNETFNSEYFSLPILVNIKILQEDCLFSLISTHLQSNLLILSSELTNKYSEEFKRIFVSYNGEGHIFEEGLSKVKKDLNYPLEPTISLVKANRNKKIFEINVQNTSFGRYYYERPARCVRLFPSLIADGVENWILVCEDKGELKEFLDGVTRIRSTKLLSYRIFNDNENFSPFTFPFIQYFLNEIIPLSERKREILLTAYNNGYFSEERGVRLKSVSEKLGVSKSYISRVLEEQEILLINMFIKGLLASF
jgi:predicted DNA binding protein